MRTGLKQSILNEINPGALTPVHRIVIPIEEILHVGTPMRLFQPLARVTSVTCGREKPDDVLIDCARPDRLTGARPADRHPAVCVVDRVPRRESLQQVVERRSRLGHVPDDHRLSKDLLGHAVFQKPGFGELLLKLRVRGGRLDGIKSREKCDALVMQPFS